jgi:hypothetical protein
MPITRFLRGHAFEPDVIRAMSDAYDRACITLGLASSRTDAVTQTLAAKIIEIAEQGIRDPILLCQEALEELNHNLTYSVEPDGEMWRWELRFGDQVVSRGTRDTQFNATVSAMLAALHHFD